MALCTVQCGPCTASLDCPRNPRSGGHGTPRQLRRILLLSLLVASGLLPYVVSSFFVDDLGVAKNNDDAILWPPRRPTSMGRTYTENAMHDKQRGRTVLVIAHYPADEWRIKAVWSHLECMVEHNKHIGKVVIAAPRNGAVQSSMLKLVEYVKESLPAVALRLEVQHYVNDRYDAGLWCDAITQGGLLTRYDNTEKANAVKGPGGTNEARLDASFHDAERAFPAGWCDACVWDRKRLCGERLDFVIAKYGGNQFDAALEIMESSPQCMAEEKANPEGWCSTCIWERKLTCGERLDFVTTKYRKNRYDAMLEILARDPQCHYVREEKKEIRAMPYVNNSYSEGEFDRFILINDSLLTLDETTNNADFDAVYSSSAAGAFDLISLSYWGDPEKKEIFHEDRHKRYWLESPLRSFSLRGIQIFADNVCNIPAVTNSNLMRVCPHESVQWLQHKKRRVKRCIVEKTEIDVAQYFGNKETIHGLYPGGIPNKSGKTVHWSHQYSNWRKLRDKLKFPFGKVSAELWPCMESRHREEARFCVRKYEGLANAPPPDSTERDSC